MAVVIDGTTGISTPAETVLGNLSYTGTLTGNGGIVNLGSGQVYKDASGKVGIGTSSPLEKLDVRNANVSFGATGENGNVNITSGLDGSNKYVTRLRTDFNGFFSISTGAVPTATAPSAGSLTERMRIDSSGNLLVGTTSVLYGASKLNVSCGSEGIATKTSLSTYSPAVFLNSSGTIVGYIYYNGTSISYNTSSDYRLKEAIAPMTGALAKVAALKPCTYKWKVDGSDGQGFIAHELAEVEAGCVTGEKDAVDAEGNPQYQGIDTSFLIATLSAAIQELHALVKTQAEDIAALKAKLP